MSVICLSKAGLALVATQIVSLEKSLEEEIGAIIQIGHHVTSGETRVYIDPDVGSHLSGKKIPGFEGIKIAWEPEFNPSEPITYIEFSPIKREQSDWFEAKIVESISKKEFICIDTTT